MWSPGGGEHWIAQGPHAVGCCHRLVCDVDGYSTILFAGTWRLRTVQCQAAPTQPAAVLGSEREFCLPGWNEKRGRKGAREGDGKLGKETVKRWVAQGFIEVMDHCVLEYLLTTWATAEAQTTKRWIARSSLIIATYTLRTMQKVYPSSLRLVTFLYCSTFLPIYCSICYTWYARAQTCSTQAWGWSHRFSSTFVWLGCVGLRKARHKVLGAACYASN